MKKNHDKSRLKKTSKRKHRNARKKIYIYIRSRITIAQNKLTSFVKADPLEIAKVLKATFPAKTDKAGVFTLKGYRFFCPQLPNRKIRIFLNEQDGLWVSPLENDTVFKVQLVETDTSGSMPEVMKDLVERVFLKNAKPLWREVYIDVDDIVLSKIKRKKRA